MALTLRNISKNYYLSYSVYKNPKLDSSKLDSEEVTQKLFNATDFKSTLLKLKTQNPTISDKLFDSSQSYEEAVDSQTVDVKGMAEDLISYSKMGSSHYSLPFLSSVDFGFYNKHILKNNRFKLSAGNCDYTTKQLSTKSQKINHFLQFDDMSFTSAIPGIEMDATA